VSSRAATSSRARAGRSILGSVTLVCIVDGQRWEWGVAWGGVSHSNACVFVIVGSVTHANPQVVGQEHPQAFGWPRSWGRGADELTTTS
jgi:hypothetical protein